jgi:hypothetical protein
MLVYKMFLISSSLVAVPYWRKFIPVLFILQSPKTINRNVQILSSYFTELLGRFQPFSQATKALRESSGIALLCY